MSRISRPRFFEIRNEKALQLAALVQSMDLSFVPPHVGWGDPSGTEVERYRIGVRAGALKKTLEGYGEAPAYLGLVIMSYTEGSEIIRTYLSRELATREADSLSSPDFGFGIIETTPSLLLQDVGFFSPCTRTVPNPALGEAIATYAAAGNEVGPQPEYAEPEECEQTSIATWHSSLYPQTYVERVYAKLAEELMRMPRTATVLAKPAPQELPVQ